MSYLRALFIYCFILLSTSLLEAKEDRVMSGMDNLMMSENYRSLLKGKRIGLITNHTALNHNMLSSIDLLKMHAKEYGYQIIAFF